MLTGDLSLTSSCAFVCTSTRRATRYRTRPATLPGSSTSCSLQTELRFSHFLSAGSQWHLRDRRHWPICLSIRGALELLNTVGEPLCGWHRAAHRHRVGGNGIFTVIGTQLRTSFLVLSFSFLFFLLFFLSKGRAMGFPKIKAALSSIYPHSSCQPASQELPGLIECILCSRRHSTPAACVPADYMFV